MADKTFVGGGGIIYRAPLGTAFPAITGGISGYGTKLTAGGFSEVGDVADDGLTFSNSVEKTEAKNWAGNVKRVLFTGHTETLAWNAIDFTDAATLKAAFGDNHVTEAEAASATHGTITKTEFTGDAPEACAWCIVMADGDKYTVIQVESGQTEVGDIPFTKDDITKIPITMTAIKGEGNATVVMYTDDGEKTGK